MIAIKFPKTETKDGSHFRAVSRSTPAPRSVLPRYFHGNLPKTLNVSAWQCCSAQAMSNVLACRSIQLLPSRQS